MHISEMPTYNLRGAEFEGRVTGNFEEIQRASDIDYYKRPANNIAEAAIAVHQLLEQLKRTNLTTAQVQKQIVVGETIEQEINSNLLLKKRLRAALQVGGIEALRAIFNHPAVDLSIETIQAWIQAE